MCHRFHRLLVLYSLLVAALLISLPFDSQAQINPAPANDCAALGLTRCPQALGGFLNILFSVINVILLFVGTIALIFFILGGVRYIISRGDEEETRKAKMMLYYALIGIIVVGFAAAIVNFVIVALQSA